MGKYTDYVRVKSRLKSMGKTQAQLAEYVGLAVPTMNQKLNGVRPLGLYEAEKVAKYLEIPDQEFATYFFSRGSAQRRKPLRLKCRTKK